MKRGPRHPCFGEAGQAVQRGNRPCSAVTSIVNASWEYIPSRADGGCTFTFGSIPACSNVSTTSAVPYDASPKTSTVSLVGAGEASCTPCLPRCSEARPQEGPFRATLPSPTLPAVTSTAVMIS